MKRRISVPSLLRFWGELSWVPLARAFEYEARLDTVIHRDGRDYTVTLASVPDGHGSRSFRILRFMDVSEISLQLEDAGGMDREDATLSVMLPPYRGRTGLFEDGPSVVHTDNVEVFINLKPTREMRHRYGEKAGALVSFVALAFEAASMENYLNHWAARWVFAMLKHGQPDGLDRMAVPLPDPEDEIWNRVVELPSLVEEFFERVSDLRSYLDGGLFGLME